MIKLTPKPKNHQNAPKTKKKLPKYPPNIKNDEETYETKKMRKIPLKPKNDQNTSKTQQKMSRIPSKPKKLPKYLQTLKNGQNNLEA